MKFYAFISGLFLLASLTIVQSVRAFQPQDHTSSNEHSSGLLQNSSVSMVSGKLGGLNKSGFVPQVSISTPSYPIGIKAKETQLIPYQLKETGHGSGEITSRTVQFFTQYDVPLSEEMGPFPARIHVGSAKTTNWNELVYLPQGVVDKARSRNDYALVLKTTFEGTSDSGEKFSTQASLLLLLPPASFSKSTPANAAVNQPTSASLHWDSTVGAIDYEYCFDMYDNDYCDGGWTGTYWLGTYDTNTALQNLPSGTTFYWQVRANNMAGSTYANNGDWWSFTTACSTSLVTVTNLYDSGAGSLRQAIADVCPGGTIEFAPSLSGQTIRLQSTLFIYKDLTIDGSALDSKIRISGKGEVTVFQVPLGFSVTLDSLVITHGNSESDAGGGIQNSGTLNIVNSVLSDNNGGLGGGIQNIGTLSIINSTFRGNSAVQGGAILNSGPLTVSNTTFLSNQANEGGGIVNQSTVEVTNSTFSQNIAVQNGGGITNLAGTANITNSTFSENSAVLGGAIYNAATLNLINTILANSPSGGDCYKDPTHATLGTNIGNLIERNPGSPNACSTTLFTGDPKLGPLTNHGGPTQTMALLPGSPAINRGNDANCPSTDQRGISRPQGAHCDIGAYEAPISFTDVSPEYWAWDFIERLHHASITAGCGSGTYCPEGIVTRAQMAVFLERSIHGSSYVPPSVGGSTGFGDVPTMHWAAAWIKQLAGDGITGGCGNDNYCPDAPVTRAQMAVFLLRSKYGASYSPPAVGGGTGFGDVAPTSWAGAWIKQLVVEGITAGCGNGNYCPDAPVTRAQMAVFLVRTLNLP